MWHAFLVAKRAAARHAERHRRAAGRAAVRACCLPAPEQRTLLLSCLHCSSHAVVTWRPSSWSPAVPCRAARAGAASACGGEALSRGRLQRCCALVTPRNNPLSRRVSRLGPCAAPALARCLRARRGQEALLRDIAQGARCWSGMRTPHDSVARKCAAGCVRRCCLALLHGSNSIHRRRRGRNGRRKCLKLVVDHTRHAALLSPAAQLAGRAYRRGRQAGGGGHARLSAVRTTRDPPRDLWSYHEAVLQRYWLRWLVRRTYGAGPGPVCRLPAHAHALHAPARRAAWTGLARRASPACQGTGS